MILPLAGTAVLLVENQIIQICLGILTVIHTIYSFHNLRSVYYIPEIVKNLL